MASDADRQKDYDEAYNQAWAATGDWQAEAHRDIQAYLGDIFTSEERKVLKLRNSDLLNIQLIRPLIKWVAGFQADQRKGIKYDPIEGGDIETANDFTELGTIVMNRNKGYNVISRAFEHALKTGLCLVNCFNDINSDTMLDHFFYNQFLMDPAWTKIDLSDCNFLMMRKFVTKEQATILLPADFKSDIKAVDDKKTSTDGKFPNYVAPLQFGHKMFAYDEFQQRDTEQKIIIIIKPTNKEFEWDGTKKELRDTLPAMLQANGVPAEMVSTITRTVPTIKVSSFIDGKHVQTQTDPFGIGDYSATPVQCFYDPEYDQMKWKLQGMVRSLKDIQRAETKRIISMVAWYENSIAGGTDFEDGAFVDPDDAFITGPHPRAINKGKIDAVRERINPPLPGGMLELHSLLTDLMPKTVNVNPDMMGLPPEAGAQQIAGILSQIRIGSGMVGLRGLFDDLSLSQSIIGRKLLKLYQQYPMEKIIRILGREPSPNFKDKKFAKFDAAVSEAPLTSTQKNTLYQEMITLMRLGQEIGKPFPAEWVDLLEIGVLQISPEQLKKIKEREQATQQAQQKAAQQQDQIQELTIKALGAETAENTAQAEERRTEAVGNMAQAGLDRAKTVTEMQDIQDGANGRKVDQLIELGKLDIERQKLLQPLQKGSV